MRPNLIRIIQDTKPTEIYNLAAQSHVQVSFETPEYTANADALGPLRLLEAIRILGLQKRTRVLSGVHIRTLRSGPRNPAARDHAVLSTISVWRP
jgi:dTDP-D-glucose 4,6-dehydratase